MAKLYVCFVFEAETRLPTESCLFITARGVAARSSASDETSLFTEAPQASTRSIVPLEMRAMRLCAAQTSCAAPLIALLSCVRKTSYAALTDARSWCGGVLERLSEYRGLQDAVLRRLLRPCWIPSVSHAASSGARRDEPCDAKEDKIA